jgi:undecaprenyl-diphosphatase
VKDPNFTIVESAREAATGYSFPSGHTQSSVGLLGSVARMTTIKVLRWGAIVLAVLVPISRMYLGVHTPADVLVSVVIAVALVLFIYPLFKRAEKDPKIIHRKHKLIW